MPLGTWSTTDNHAYPIRAVREGEEDREFDALIPDELEPAPLPLKLRPDNPQYVAAWRALYGYTHDDMNAAHLHEVVAAKQRTMREKGDDYPAWRHERSLGRRGPNAQPGVGFVDSENPSHVLLEIGRLVMGDRTRPVALIGMDPRIDGTE